MLVEAPVEIQRDLVESAKLCKNARAKKTNKRRH